MTLVGAPAVLAAPPVNDGFANATPIGPALPAEAPGVTFESTAEPGEPSVSLGGTVWYRFTPTESAQVAFGLCDEASVNHTLTAFTGASVGALTKVEAPHTAQCPASAFHGQVIEVEAAQSYSIRVAANVLEGSPFTLHLFRVGDAPGNAECIDAEAKLEAAKAKLKRASAKLKAAKQAGAAKAKLKRLKEKRKKAKQAVARADDAVATACG